MKVIEELFTAAAKVAVIPQTGRSEHDIAKDLCRAIEITDDETFKTLSQGAQDWYNTSVQDINNGKTISYPKDKEEVTTVTAVATESTEEKPVSLSPDIAREVRKVARIKKEKESEPPPISASEMVRQIVISHLDWTEAQVMAEAQRLCVPNNILPNKITDNLIWTVRSFALPIMKTAIKLGWGPPTPSAATTDTPATPAESIPEDNKDVTTLV